jgi:hypothetical protein
MSISQINIQGEVLVIEHLEVYDEITRLYITQLDGESQGAGVLNCLQLGARALTFAGDQTGASLLAETLKTSTEATKTLLDHVSRTAQQSVMKSAEDMPKQVQRELEKLRKDLEKSLDPANTESIVGRLRDALLNDYKKVTARVRKDLDLGNPLSPLAALSSDMERKHSILCKGISELQQQNAAKTATRLERAKSSRKGADFEAALDIFLTAESRRRKDLARRTGKELGIDGNMVGDFVVEVNPSDAADVRIVIEAKNWNTQKSPASLFREVDKAMKNRGAAFGIAVTANEVAGTHSIVPFGDDKLLVRCSLLEGDEGWDMLALGVALECARWKAIMARVAIGKVDVKRVRADVDTAFQVMNRFTEMKKRVSMGKTHLDGIAEYLDDLRRDLTTVLQRLRETAMESNTVRSTK